MARVMVHGVAGCECIRDSIGMVEKRFVAAGMITRDFSGLISQGCYSTSVAASKGTHAGGGVWDLDDWTSYRTDVDVLFTACGWIAFHRIYGQLYPKSPAHWHVVLNGCPHLDPTAQRQIVDAKAGLNGLAGKGKDSGPRPLVTWQAVIAAHNSTPTQKEDDDMASQKYLHKFTGHPAVFFGDLETCRWVKTAEEAADLDYETRSRFGNTGLPVAGPGVILIPAYVGTKLARNVAIRVLGRKELVGVIEGDMPAGWTEAK